MPISLLQVLKERLNRKQVNKVGVWLLTSQSHSQQSPSSKLQASTFKPRIREHMEQIEGRHVRWGATKISYTFIHYHACVCHPRPVTESRDSHKFSCRYKRCENTSYWPSVLRGRPYSTPCTQNVVGYHPRVGHYLLFTATRSKCIGSAR